PGLASVPPTLFVPAGATGGTFPVVTAAVAVPTRVTFDSGTGFENYHAPQNSLVLLPAGSPAPAASLSSISLALPSVLGGGPGTTGTATLTAPAPAGGAIVRLSASMEGQVIAPQSVTVPAGALSADFALTAPEVNAPRFVLVQGTYGASGATA